MQTRLSICICTCDRPSMLLNCLDSINVQDNSLSWNVEILVVDNSADNSSPTVTHGLRMAIPMRFAHEPCKGIPFARNKALEESVKNNADWIAFVDDDETADRSWLRVMQSLAATANADVLHGQTESVSAEDHGPREWPQRVKKRRRKSGQVLRTAGTDNVMFKSHLVTSQGMALRFDENMRFSGGSDRDFFYRAYDRGARILWVPEAKTYETIPASRRTFWYQVNRAQSVAANECYISAKRSGWGPAVTKIAPKAVGRLVTGLFLLPLGALGMPTRSRTLRLLLLEASKRIGSAIGTFRGFINHRPSRYRNIHGN